MNSLTTETKTHKLDVSKFSKDKSYVYLTEKEKEKIFIEINVDKKDYITFDGEYYPRSNLGGITKLTQEDRDYLNTQYGSEVYWYTDEIPEGKYLGNTVYSRPRYEVTPHRKSEGGSSKKLIWTKYCYYDENCKRVYCEKEDIKYIPCNHVKKIKDLKNNFGVQS